MVVVLVKVCNVEVLVVSVTVTVSEMVVDV